MLCIRLYLCLYWFRYVLGPLHTLDLLSCIYIYVSSLKNLIPYSAIFLDYQFLDVIQIMFQPWCCPLLFRPCIKVPFAGPSSTFFLNHCPRFESNLSNKRVPLDLTKPPRSVMWLSFKGQHLVSGHLSQSRETSQNEIKIVFPFPVSFAVLTAFIVFAATEFIFK